MAKRGAMPFWEKIVIGIGVVVALLALWVFLAIRSAYPPYSEV